MAKMTFTHSHEEKVDLFFRHLKKELGIPSTRDLVRLVGKVLSPLRRGLSAGQISRLVDRLPGIFQLMIVHDRNNFVNTKKESFGHLDELVESIYAEDKRSANSIFTTEIEALNAIIVVLRKLDKFMNLFSYNILTYPVVKELKQIPMEDAA